MNNPKENKIKAEDIESSQEQKKWIENLRIDNTNTFDIFGLKKMQELNESYYENFENEINNANNNKSRVTLYDILKFFEDKNPNEILRERNGNSNYCENVNESTRDNSTSTTKNNNFLSTILKCKCDSSSACQKCSMYNFCFSEKFTKILMTILENSIKEEVISILVANSLRDLNEKKIKDVISKMDMNETISSFFRTDIDLESQDISPSTDGKIKNGDEKMLNRKRIEKQTKLVTACAHVDKKHYAKNLCYNCYHREGRAKKAWACNHIDRPHYAHGMCHNCYQTMHIEKIKHVSCNDFNDKRLL